MRSIIAVWIGLVLIAATQIWAADKDPSAETHKVVREAGVAMYMWLGDQLKGTQSVYDEARSGKQPEWSSCSTPPEEVAELVVPKYIPELPRVDAWGHALQFCFGVDRKHPEATKSVLGVRSAGRDGKFTDGLYEAGPFPRSDLNQDIVWADGYFLRWPSKSVPQQ